MRLRRYDEVKPSKPQRRTFDCGNDGLNNWLATQARQSMDSRDAVTYLLTDEDSGDAIVGYFCLSAGDVAKETLALSLSSGAPNPAPVVRMGRFAVDRRYQGKGWAADLLREALLRSAAASELIGGRAMLVDAIDDNAKMFYRRFGFEQSPIHERQVLIDLRTVDLSAKFTREAS